MIIIEPYPQQVYNIFFHCPLILHIFIFQKVIERLWNAFTDHFSFRTKSNNNIKWRHYLTGQQKFDFRHSFALKPSISKISLSHNSSYTSTFFHRRWRYPSPGTETMSSICRHKSEIILFLTYVLLRIVV